LRVDGLEYFGRLRSGFPDLEFALSGLRLDDLWLETLCAKLMIAAAGLCFFPVADSMRAINDPDAGVGGELKTCGKLPTGSPDTCAATFEWFPMGANFCGLDGEFSSLPFWCEY